MQTLTMTSPAWGTDADTVQFAYESPDGLITLWTFGVDAGLTRTGAGQYQAAMPVSIPGTYRGYWTATNLASQETVITL